jgi:hypothetical protein
MIDPTKITNFELDHAGLEEVILFWICAAGKNGVTAAKCLDKLLCMWGFSGHTPFDIINRIRLESNLAQEMKRCGLGCYNNKSLTFCNLVDAKLNLQICELEELEAIKGIGPKTARCFLIHTRPKQRYAGLDTHCLKFLRDQGHKVPKSTPVGKKYRELELLFLEYVDKANMSVSEFDLKIWNYYRTKNNYDRLKDRKTRNAPFVTS